MKSERFTLNVDDLKSLLWTALIFGVAAVVTYVLDNIKVLNLGGNEELVVFILGLLGKFLQKVLSGR
jgi:hypothetical protein